MHDGDFRILSDCGALAPYLSSESEWETAETLLWE